MPIEHLRDFILLLDLNVNVISHGLKMRSLVGEGRSTRRSSRGDVSCGGRLRLTDLNMEDFGYEVEDNNVFNLQPYLIASDILFFHYTLFSFFFDHGIIHFFTILYFSIQCFNVLCFLYQKSNKDYLFDSGCEIICKRS